MARDGEHTASEGDRVASNSAPRSCRRGACSAAILRSLLEAGSPARQRLRSCSLVLHHLKATLALNVAVVRCPLYGWVDCCHEILAAIMLTSSSTVACPVLTPPSAGPQLLAITMR